MHRQHVDFPPPPGQAVSGKGDDKANHPVPSNGQPGLLWTSGQHSTYILGAIWRLVERRTLDLEQSRDIGQGAVERPDDGSRTLAHSVTTIPIKRQAVKDVCQRAPQVVQCPCPHGLALEDLAAGRWRYARS
jgi:hypothetical protein